jgi:hypothetical protein
MTITDEAKELRAEVSKLRPDKRRRYGDALTERILAWVERAVAGGMTESACGHTLGIKTWRFRMWRDATKTKSPSLALVPIDTVGPLALGSRPVLIAPTGHRVEGLAISELITLLRELS